MTYLNPKKLENLTTFNDRLDEKYGKCMLRDRRKELKLTQKQVAEKLGREQSYIARVENGKADIQLSSFFRIASILGIQFVPTFINIQ